MKDMSAEVDWNAVEQELVLMLRTLVGIDTSYGRHGETVAARFIQSLLSMNDLADQTQIFEPVPGKGSVVCRLPGQNADESLLLLSHLDVAPAHHTSEWLHPPFNGAYRHGEIWGRGTIDCKGLVAVWLMLIILLKRNRIPLRRGVVFAATSDEESGGKWGIDWILNNTAALQGCRYVLNEGGGFSFHLKDQDVYTIQYAEKGHTIFEYIVEHPSLPFASQEVLVPPLNGQAIHPLMKASLRAGGLPEILTTPLSYRTKVFLLRHACRQLPLDINGLFHNLLRIDLPERFDHHHSVIKMHLRLLPGQSAEDINRMIAAKGLIPASLIKATSVTTVTEPSCSSIDSSLFRIIESTMVRNSGHTNTMLPFLTPSATDSRYVRAKGMIAYGFFPTPPSTDIRLIHQPNERIPVNDLLFSLKKLYEIVTRFAG
ncbi:M20/M25/M40 family metallo-hydrolase [Paenibacillus mesotrionivorans]|uniref:M20/M25/M40 family metallo-hydrolase n=1 Tax=Paenibacillus mesotrionivorans TaxID=3160968 RepID=A0ACC7P171_9BACL